MRSPMARHRAPGPASGPARPAVVETSGSTAAGSGGRHRGRAVVVRVIAAVVVVLVWLGGAAIGGSTFGALSEVSSNDQSTFLPATAESTRAGDQVQRFTDSEQIPAVVVAELPGGQALTEDMSAGLRDLAERAGEVHGVDRVIGPTAAEDGQAAQLIVLIDTETADPDEAVGGLRALMADAGADHAPLPAPALQNVDLHVGGPAGLTADLAGAFAGIDGLLLIVALSAVLVILVLVYRSVLLPMLVLFNSLAALCVAVVAIYWMARGDWIVLNGQSQGILFILVIGAATDYSLLMVARYREELRAQESRWTAVRGAWRGSFGAITASAATVAVALLCLLVSDLNSNRSLGPIAASGIVLAWLASLTFLPALLGLAGRRAFWPSVPRPGSVSRSAKTFEQPQFADGRPIPGLEGDHGVWTRVGTLVARRPRTVWTVTAVVLLAGAVGIVQLRADGVPQTEVILGASDSTSAQRVLEEHFEAGTGSPATVIAPPSLQDQVLETVEDADGVASASFVAEGGAPAGAGPPSGPPEGVEVPEAPALEPQEVDGRVYLQATLEDPADSEQAEQTVRQLREDLHALDGQILVGGTTATTLDANATAQADLRVIIPLVLLVVLGILMILLRSVLAPVLLVLATVLSFGTAMGVSALVFNHVFGFSGADPSVPLYGFVFLVALGVDYTIFLMTRAREESLKASTRPGVLRALTVTGGVITSAGIVLAATFATLAVIPLMFMVQLAFIVAFGVLLDTFLVRSLLVPALTYDIGPAVWWPSRLSRRADGRFAPGHRTGALITQDDASVRRP